MRGPRVERRAGQPHPARRVEREVHRLLNFRFGRDKLDFETGGQMKECALLVRSTQPGLRGVAALGVGDLLRPEDTRQPPRGEEAKKNSGH